MILGRYAVATRAAGQWRDTVRTDAEHLPAVIARLCRCSRMQPVQVADLATGAVVELEAGQMHRVAERLRLETIAPSPLDRAEIPA